MGTIRSLHRPEARKFAEHLDNKEKYVTFWGQPSFTYFPLLSAPETFSGADVGLLGK